jgi:hypothetical protein
MQCHDMTELQHCLQGNNNMARLLHSTDQLMLLTTIAYHMTPSQVPGEL